MSGYLLKLFWFFFICLFYNIISLWKKIWCQYWKGLTFNFSKHKMYKILQKGKKKDYFNNFRYISVYMCFITFIPFSITSRLHSFTSEVKFPLEELSPFHFIFSNAFRWKQSNRESQNDIAEEFYIFSLIFTTTFT